KRSLNWHVPRSYSHHDELQTVNQSQSPPKRPRSRLTHRTIATSRKSLQLSSWSSNPRQNDHKRLRKNVQTYSRQSLENEIESLNPLESPFNGVRLFLLRKKKKFICEHTFLLESF